MNKSLATNLIAILIFAGAYFGPEHAFKNHIVQAALFALSGALTNWLAVYMLFEKIPGLYGSGIVPNRFEQFKSSIRSLIVENFLTRSNFDKYLQDTLEKKLDLDTILDKLFTELQKTAESSSLGSVLSMFGGSSVLEPMRQPFIERAQKIIDDAEIIKQFTQEQTFDTLHHQVMTMVDRKLEELTPQRVKDIIQKMIRKHLGWLVVWGGVFGALIGFFSALFL